MLKGFNSDIVARGQKFHVQTEDWGQQNPFLVTRVFREGAVFKTFKISYDDALRSSSVRTLDALKMALQKQHSAVIDQLMTGSL